MPRKSPEAIKRHLDKLRYNNYMAYHRRRAEEADLAIRQIAALPDSPQKRISLEQATLRAIKHRQKLLSFNPHKRPVPWTDIQVEQQLAELATSMANQMKGKFPPTPEQLEQEFLVDQYRARMEDTLNLVEGTNPRALYPVALASYVQLKNQIPSLDIKHPDILKARFPQHFKPTGDPTDLGPIPTPPPYEPTDPRISKVTGERIEHDFTKPELKSSRDKTITELWGELDSFLTPAYVKKIAGQE